MESKHTPGPWHIGAAHNLVVYAPDGFAVADATVFHGRHEGREGAAANAALIALAPELYALAVHAARQDIAPDVIQKRAHAILARVDGI